MSSRNASKILWAVLLPAVIAVGCRDQPSVTPGKQDAGTTDGGNQVPDSGPTDSGVVTTSCNNPPIDPPASGTCSFTAGSSYTLIQGDIVVPSGILENGQLLIGPDGIIACAACDCSAQTGAQSAAKLACAKGLVGPAFINAHEHLDYGEGSPVGHGQERFEHRHDWREGQNGHTELDTPGRSDAPGARWAELRHVFGGATSVVGAAGEQGLLRNLDRSGLDEGLGAGAMDNSTFPLGDSRGERQESGCDYPRIDSATASSFTGAVAYVPHVAEGITVDARNEYACVSRSDNGGQDLMASKTAIVHGVGLTAQDYAEMSSEGVALVWSPRTNIDLYGHTAPVVMAKRLGMAVALGTDWPASGSMNMLRELRCAYELNRNNYGNAFSDRDLYDMATLGAARALQADSKVGSLIPGLVADVTILDESLHSEYLAAVFGEPKTVALVLRSGRPLFGDAPLVEGLSGADGCEEVDVCGVRKRACAQRETGSTIAEIRAAIDPSTIDLFVCGNPANEPSCVPSRSGEFSGMSSSDDVDGDGIANGNDKCPNVFDAIRPVDQGAQPDADNDGEGDACDPCPFDADSTTCSAPDPADRDRDGRPNASDNCPDNSNPGQEDQDGDQKGDVCDVCPAASNPGNAGCPATIYQLKKREVLGAVHVTNALVSASGTQGYFLQIAPGDAAYDNTLGATFSGIFVFTGSMGTKPAAGDRVDVDGTAVDFQGQLELTNATFNVLSSGNPIPAAISVNPADVKTGGPQADAYEGVLVEVSNVEVTNENPDAPQDFNEFSVTGDLRVNDYLFAIAPRPTLGQRFSRIRGVLRFGNGNYKLEPRSADDVVMTATLSRFDPETASMRSSTSNSPFFVVLTAAAASDTQVQLTSSSAATTVPASVTITAGTDRAAVPVTAGAPESVTLTASLDGVMRTATLTVFDDTSPRLVSSLALDATALRPNGMTDGRVTISAPGQTTGTVVTLEVTPAGIVTIPSSVTVAADQLEATFTVAAGATDGDATITARLGSSSQSVTVQVRSSTTRAPAQGELVVTEIHYNPSNPTSGAEAVREWFEVQNVTTDSLTIDGLIIKDASTQQAIAAPGVEIAPGAYAVFTFSSNASEHGVPASIAAYGAMNAVQLNNSGDSLVIELNGVEIDRVAFASAWGGANGASLCLKAPYATDNNVAGAWGTSVGTFGPNGDQGSPGVASDATNCP